MDLGGYDTDSLCNSLCRINRFCCSCNSQLTQGIKYFDWDDGAKQIVLDDATRDQDREIHTGIKDFNWPEGVKPLDLDDEAMDLDDEMDTGINDCNWAVELLDHKEQDELGLWFRGQHEKKSELPQLHDSELPALPVKFDLPPHLVKMNHTDNGTEARQGPHLVKMNHKDNVTEEHQGGENLKETVQALPVVGMDNVSEAHQGGENLKETVQASITIDLASANLQSAIKFKTLGVQLNVKFSLLDTIELATSCQDTEINPNTNQNETIGYDTEESYKTKIVSV